jgi:Flp pilus assembly protein TadG
VNFRILRSWRSRQASNQQRGQGLVEFAIILPLLTLLMVMALDFGRVFFGWVALQNAARVAADFAAENSNSWTTPDDTLKQDERERYEVLIDKDAAAINCAMDAIPAPVFTDASTGTLDTSPEPGDHAAVQLDCELAMLTPLASSVLGGGVDMSARAEFAVIMPDTLNLPEEGVPAPPPGCDTGQARVPDLVGKTMQNAFNAWDVDFIADNAHFDPDLVGTGPSSNKNKIVKTQNPTVGTCHPTDGSMTVGL